MSIQFIYDDVLEKKKKALNEIVKELEPKKKAPRDTIFLRRFMFACFKGAAIVEKANQLPEPPKPVIRRVPVIKKNLFTLNPNEIVGLDRSNLDLY